MPTSTHRQAIEIAMDHHRAGRLAEADAIYRQLLADDPNNADALHLLGIIASQLGQTKLAVEMIRRAVALIPDDPTFHSNLGNALTENGEFEEAVAACRRALQLQPDFGDAHQNLGVALSRLGRNEEAIASFCRAIQLMPGCAQAHNNLGNERLKKGQLEEAIAGYRRAIRLKPNFADAYNNLGNACRQKLQVDEAIAHYRAAIQLQPDHAGAHNNLGAILNEMGRMEPAIAAYRRAIELKPDYAEAHNNLGLALMDQGGIENAVSAFRRAMELKPDYEGAHSNLLIALNYQPGLDPAAVAEEHRAWDRRHARSLRQFIQPHANDPAPDRRLRIGYVSPDFREHSVGHFLLPLLARHDHDAFEIFCYAQVPAPDAMTAQLRACADHWHTLTGCSDAQAAELIRQHGIDILVDLSGHTSCHRLLVFACKPAPVQVTWLGYPNTTGLSTMDYRLTDAQADPPGLTERNHSEQLFRLDPCAWCFQPPHSPPIPPRPEGAVTFGCFNNFAKITAPMLALWARILQPVPGSHLLLKARGLASEETCAQLRRSFEKMGIAPERLELRGHEGSHEQHLALYHRVDVALDTFPYHGTTTTCEALWMGVPVVSLAGTTHASRVGVSLLTAAGLPESIAHDEGEYVRLATMLAGDRPLLSRLRATLREQMAASPLMDSAHFARNVEGACREMWRAWCARR